MFHSLRGLSCKFALFSLDRNDFTFTQLIPTLLSEPVTPRYIVKVVKTTPVESLSHHP